MSIRDRCGKRREAAKKSDVRRARALGLGEGAYILGVQHPVATAFPEDEQLVIQKAFFDPLWEVSLSTMVGTIGSAWPFASPFDDIASRLNCDNAAHASSMKSFAQVYRDEINGVLELAAPIAAAVRKPVGRRALRTLHVGALLHAALRWNRTQKLNANDMFDFMLKQHGATAMCSWQTGLWTHF